ncbi:MAG: sugar ABC transporter ATP-binding protein, partial [Rhizobiales bacterium]|nr:sugar ABC transporter ATP-binding protein [Hyphomicrobiales bacterium]
MTEAGEPLASLRAIRKDYGSVRVLNGVDFDVHPGRVLAVMGHNGAGKSTLMQILAGTTPRSGGTIALAGAATAEPYDADRAQSLGVRCVFQELSLCPNLTVTENTRLVHPALRGRGWRRRARALILAKLDEIYPGHGIDPDTPVADLSIAHRQVIETARAFTATDRPLRIVILDEPTSALDVRSAGQLLAHMRRAAAQGIAVLFISHR